MHTDISAIATPETLEDLAEAHGLAGDSITARTFRAMATAWRADQRALSIAQAENSQLAHTLTRAHESAQRVESLAVATSNVLAAIRAPVRPQVDATEQVPA